MSWAETKLIIDAVTENGIQGSNGTIIMVPMDANKYGYNMKLLDIDGVTPLNDVLITGVNDVSGEVRTNKQGVAKFISSSASHTLTFSEFPSGYDYTDLYPQQSVRGYINDMTEIVVAPNVANYAGYSVTLLDDSGAPAANVSATCTTNGKTYNTDSAGKIAETIYNKATSLTFTWESSPMIWNTVDGILQRECYTKYTTSVSGGIIGQTTSLTSASASTSTGQAASNYRINASSTVGSYLTIGGNQYLIAHNDGANVYAVLRYWKENTKFNVDGSITYNGSDIASKCSTWYNNISSNWRDANVFNTSYTHEGVVGACFIPSFSQANSGWSYFNSLANRIFKDSGGTAYDWWTSSEFSSSDVWYVNIDGRLSGSYPTGSAGFRPALCIKRSAFAS